MPTFDNPLSDAAEASEALRGLAHATRTFDNTADTYAVIGDLLSAFRSLRQVFDQLAITLLTHQDRAFNDAGDNEIGAGDALAASDELHQAGSLLDAAIDRLDAASQASGRIAWHPATTVAEPEIGRASCREGVESGTVELLCDASVGSVGSSMTGY